MSPPPLVLDRHGASKREAWPGVSSDLLNVAEEPANAATVKALATMVREG